MIAPWGWVAGTFGGVLAVTGLAVRLRRPRSAVVAGCALYGLAALWTGSIVDVLWVQLVAPGALLLGGYWLSGLFFRDPQPWLERRLLASDRRVFTGLNLDAVIARLPRWTLELLEASYAAVYVVTGLGAVFMAAQDTAAVRQYWSIVLSAGLACYLALPWLRSRPPRVLEQPGSVAARAPQLRKLNTAVLDRASVQANTIPSGHVAVITAAALAVLVVSPAAGWALLSLAVLVAAAAVLGRYHYAVDCLGGAAVGLIWWLLVGSTAWHHG